MHLVKYVSCYLVYYAVTLFAIMPRLKDRRWVQVFAID